MPTTAVRMAELERRLGGSADSPATVPLPSTPLELLTRQLASVGGRPRGWQVAALEDAGRNIFCLAGRQVGKGSMAAARLVHDSGHSGGGLHLVVSASQRQAQIVIERCAAMAQFLGPSVKVEVTATEVRVGSTRIVALPSSSSSLRGWTVTGGDNPDVKGTLLLDEGCFIGEDAWNAVVPTTVAHAARIMITSSAGGIGHWTQQLFDSDDESWSRYRVRAEDCEDYDVDFLTSERLRLPADVYRAEYESQFRAVVSGDPVFDPALLQRSFTQSSHDQAGDLPDYFDLADPSSWKATT